MNTKTRKNQPSKKKLILITGLSVVALLISSAFCWFYWGSKTKTTLSPATNSSDLSLPAANRTYTSTTENRSVTVPSNVDPSSIKNYTLVVDNEEYKIRILDGDYYITLYAIINHPDQASTYRDQLKQYKQDALNYLTNHNIDITKITINYEPAEAATL